MKDPPRSSELVPCATWAGCRVISSLIFCPGCRRSDITIGDNTDQFAVGLDYRNSADRWVDQVERVGRVWSGPIVIGLTTMRFQTV